jgi:O-succinylhomoserine sulfhydrylase
LGDTRTIVTHPATSTHSKLSAEERALVGITDGLIRISIGLENIEDIKYDVEQALDKVIG